MTQDIQFTVGDKDLADSENSKLNNVEKWLKEEWEWLSDENLTLLTQAITDWANDSLQDLDNQDNE